MATLKENYKGFEIKVTDEKIEINGNVTKNIEELVAKLQYSIFPLSIDTMISLIKKEIDKGC